MHYVIEAVYFSEYQLVVRFENGQEKLVDLAPHLDGPVFEPLKDLQFFRRFSVNPDIDTLAWPNGADFSPDFLYEIGLDIVEKSTFGDGSN